jgi:hypothetical protein
VSLLPRLRVPRNISSHKDGEFSHQKFIALSVVKFELTDNAKINKSSSAFSDSVHNISIESFERMSLYEWKADAVVLKDCVMKTLDQVLHTQHNKQSTPNSYRPLAATTFAF